ncbi:MAG: anthranilate synthase component I [Proteobacteria bacterium]|nr:anthranilate synthase component I [Pseudomonadota bacterium]MBU1389133.1 anthranilate synthase component I [Pseudomonadota bacterium]MBU1543357.1 anthranilate synthase component I [Pseudomonadota bacterium]MBU2480898.1 anthranilate synthase component I [Pseudomonadota bacterium]
MILNQFPDKQVFLTLAQTSNVIPVCTQILADMETPVSILQKFYSPDKESFLLESVEGGERWAQYSFLGLSAYGTIKIFANDVQIKTQRQTQTIAHHNDPMDVIRTYSKKFIPAPIPELPRFWSGFTGYCTYEMVSFFENIPVSLPEGTPYAHFIIPDEMIIFDNIKQTLTCMKICYITEDTDPSDIFDQAQAHLKKMLATIHAPVMPKKPVQSKHVELMPETPAKEYMSGVEKIKHHIIEGDVFQAVYSQPFSCKTQVDPVQIYRAQRYINPSPYMFFMNFTDMVIAGSSPETMVRLENNIATLRPIAGTRPRGKTQQEDRKLADELLNDEKEKAEHVMLIDLGRNDLGRVAEAGTVQVTDTMVIERYSHVMHLVSNITCDLKEEFDAYDLFKATFPAGTLSGAPKIRAMEIISELEGKPRGVYGGAAGYISFSGNMDFAITIRTAVMKDGKLTVQAGAGIVYDSDPLKELQECQNKARSVEMALKLVLSNTNGDK